MSDIDWDDLISSYRAAIAAGAAPKRALSRYLSRKGIGTDRLLEIAAELDRRLDAAPDPSPPDPAPLPPPSAPAAPAEPTPPLSAPERRVESDMPEAIHRLHRKGVASILSSPGLSQEDQVDAISELAAKTIDAATDTGPLEEIDGEMMSHGFKALFFFLHELGERDPGNLRARADRAAARGNTKRAERLRKIAAEIEARG